jgi:hypothetical protein
MNPKTKDKRLAVVQPILLEILAVIILPRISSVVSKKLSNYATKAKPRAKK